MSSEPSGIPTSARASRPCVISHGSKPAVQRSIHPMSIFVMVIRHGADFRRRRARLQTAPTSAAVGFYHRSGERTQIVDATSATAFCPIAGRARFAVVMMLDDALGVQVNCRYRRNAEVSISNTQ